MAGDLAESGQRVGDVFYATADGRGFVALDVGDPEHPVELATVRLPHVLESEDLATDWKILLMSQGLSPAFVARGWVRPVLGSVDGSVLHVFDVENPGAPRRLATVAGAGVHTITCVLHCTWAYGSAA